MCVSAFVCVYSWLYHVFSSLKLTYVREKKNASGFDHADIHVGVKMCLYQRNCALLHV